MDDEWKRVYSSWKEGGCSCKTFDEHKNHLNHLAGISDRAKKVQEKFDQRGGVQPFLDMLENASEPARPHLRLIIGGKK